MFIRLPSSLYDSLPEVIDKQLDETLKKKCHQSSITQPVGAFYNIWGCLTSFYAVLHQVSVQTGSSDGFRRTPLYGHCGVGDVVHDQHGGLAGHSWVEIKVLEIRRVVTTSTIPPYVFQQWVWTKAENIHFGKWGTSEPGASLSPAGMLSVSMSDLIRPRSCRLFLYSESHLTPIEPSDRPDLLNL